MSSFNRVKFRVVRSQEGMSQLSSHKIKERESLFERYYQKVSGTGKEGKPILGSIIQITVVQSRGYIPPDKRENGHPKDERLEYLSITFLLP